MNNEENLKLGFGGIIKEPDKRDYDLHAINQKILGGAAIANKSSNNDYSSIPIDMQGKQPACGAHAGARLKNILNLRAGRLNKLHGSPRFNWKNIKDIDGVPIEVGTSINAIFKSMRNRGVCDFGLTGNDVELSLEDYRNLQVTDIMTSDGINNETEAEAFIYRPTWEQICQTIDLHGACIGLISVGQNMYKDANGNGTWSEAGILPLSPTNYPMDSGHFIVFENYDENYIYFGNEWSTAWGRNGIGYINRSYMPYVVQIGTCVNKSLAPVKYQFTRDLSYGSVGQDVIELQKRLGVTPTFMAFGPKTKAAVIAYQKANNINPALGYVGPITRASLNK